MGKATRIRIEPGEKPTPEQMAKGDTMREFVMHAETATTAIAHRTAHSPVERWKRAGRLSDSQISAIALCEALWAAAGLRQKVTASYGERIASGDNEWRANTEIQARKDLGRIQGYFMPWQWKCFENVVRFGESTGTAGEALGFTGTKEARGAIRMLVMNVADIIAREERLA